MGLLDKFLNTSTKKKIKVDDLLQLLTIVNGSFDKIANKVEKHLFIEGIIDDYCPIEQQPDRVELKENFKNRFIISAGITGMALIEYVMTKKYGDTLYNSELLEFKKIIFPNLLKVREKVLRYSPAPEFEEDKEPSLINSNNAEEQFIQLITRKAQEINKRTQTGEYGHLYFNFYWGIGQVLTNPDASSYSKDFANLIDNKISEVIELLNVYYFEHI
jgi:hypothetical protein